MAKRSDEALYELPEVKLPKKVPQLTLVSPAGLDSMPIAVLLAEAHALREAEKRLREVKEKIREAIHAQGYADPTGRLGVRAGTSCALVRWSEGRASLSKELLVENGVSPAQIEASTKRGEGFWVLELPEITGE